MPDAPTPDSGGFKLPSYAYGALAGVLGGGALSALATAPQKENETPRERTTRLIKNMAMGGAVGGLGGGALTSGLSGIGDMVAGDGKEHDTPGFLRSWVGRAILPGLNMARSRKMLPGRQVQMLEKLFRSEGNMRIRPHAAGGGISSPVDINLKRPTAAADVKAHYKSLNEQLKGLGRTRSEHDLNLIFDTMARNNNANPANEIKKALERNYGKSVWRRNLTPGSVTTIGRGYRAANLAGSALGNLGLYLAAPDIANHAIHGAHNAITGGVKDYAGGKIETGEAPPPKPGITTGWSLF